MLGKGLAGSAELPPILVAIGLLDPVASFKVALVVHRPVLVQREVECFDGDASPRQVGEGRTIQERTMIDVPLRPVERAVCADLRRCAHLAAPAVRQDVERQTVLMGQAVKLPAMIRQAVAIHLGDERELVGQAEIPNGDREWHIDAVHFKHAHVLAWSGVLRNLKFQKAALG